MRNMCQDASLLLQDSRNQRRSDDRIVYLWRGRNGQQVGRAKSLRLQVGYCLACSGGCISVSGWSSVDIFDLTTATIDDDPVSAIRERHAIASSAKIEDLEFMSAGNTREPSSIVDLPRYTSNCFSVPPPRIDAHRSEPAKLR